jgi:hypothetical protein
VALVATAGAYVKGKQGRLRRERRLCDFREIHVHDGSHQIVGATVVASHAGEIISVLSVSMVGKLGLSRIARTIHPYPMQAEGIRFARLATPTTHTAPQLAAPSVAEVGQMSQGHSCSTVY